MQLGMVFNQAKWFAAGDVDDCAVLSGIQMVWATSPWCRLVSVPAFRSAAMHPDSVPGGLTNVQLFRGLQATYPEVKGHIVKHDGSTWDRLVQDVEDGRPCSLAVDSSKLPAAARFGFNGRHRVTVAKSGKRWVWYFLNPLAPVYSRPLVIHADQLKPAITAFGLLQNGTPGAVYISGPTDAEALHAWHPDDTPYSQEDLDAATAALQARIDGAVQTLTGGKG